MRPWKHTRAFEVVDGREPSQLARELADVLDTLPDGFREKRVDGESLDDFARFLREDSERGCELDDIDGWLSKIYDWGDQHSLFLAVTDWRAQP